MSTETLRQIEIRLARRLAIGAVCVVAAAELFNGTFCYGHSIHGYLTGLAFAAVGFLPGLAMLFSANPLRTVGAAVLFVPWLVLAFYADCVRPYQGGGASMVYIAVALYGFISSVVGAALTDTVLRLAGFKVAATSTNRNEKASELGSGG